jgi:hypothetical protein
MGAAGYLLARVQGDRHVVSFSVCYDVTEVGVQGCDLIPIVLFCDDRAMVRILYQYAVQERRRPAGTRITTRLHSVPDNGHPQVVIRCNRPSQGLLQLSESSGFRRLLKTLGGHLIDMLHTPVNISYETSLAVP